eukprot:gene42672-52137_t
MTLRQLILCLLLVLPLQRGFQFLDLPYEQVLKRSLALEGRFAEVKSAVQLWGESFRLREGPSASLSAAELIVWSGLCRSPSSPHSPSNASSAASCSLLRHQYPGLTEHDVDWLSFLAHTRDIHIIPTTNCLGYLQGRRGEGGLDPNRDFPFARTDKRCFLTRTA